MKILTICPTKRPELCKRMVESFKETSTEKNDLILGINIGDENIIKYNEILCHKVIVKNDSTVTKIINDIYKIYPNYDYYHVTNDDVIYRTKAWDTKLTYILEEYGGGIAYGNDLLQRENLCTFPMISSSISKITGWLQLPTLNHGYCSDNIWKLIGDNCKCLYYLPGVIIEHKWEGNLENPVDKEDMAKFSEWLPTSHLITNKIKEMLCLK